VKRINNAGAGWQHFLKTLAGKELNVCWSIKQSYSIRVAFNSMRA